MSPEKSCEEFSSFFATKVCSTSTVAHCHSGRLQKARWPRRDASGLPWNPVQRSTEPRFTRSGSPIKLGKRPSLERENLSRASRKRHTREPIVRTLPRKDRAIAWWDARGLNQALTSPGICGLTTRFVRIPHEPSNFALKWNQLQKCQ